MYEDVPGRYPGAAAEQTRGDTRRGYEAGQCDGSAYTGTLQASPPVMQLHDRPASRLRMM